MASKLQQNFPYLLFKYLVFIYLVSLTSAKAPDLCGDNKNFDLSPLQYGSPWRVTKIFNTTNLKHAVDILPCQTFSSLKDDDIHENCKSSSICHAIANKSAPTNFNFIGYNPIQIIPEYQTYRVRYAGPVCSEGINYTIDIRFICGNNLGYPSYPTFNLVNNCSTTLYWETSAACKGSSSSSSFGVNERPCYVIDNFERRRDLSPLIRPNGSYRVWSADAKDFYINVCTDSNNKCSSGSGVSACIRNEHGIMESVGSYKWSEIEFKPANALVSYDHIELTYKSKNGCNKFSGSSMNESTTVIRFICPKYSAHHRRYPILISNMDCRYEIEWVTNYACPQEDITFKNNNDCKIEDVDFNQFKNDKLYDFSNITTGNGNVSISFNICGSIDLPGNTTCPKNSGVCITNYDNGKASYFDINRKDANFRKADNHVSLIYSSRKASCTGGKYWRTIVEFECDYNTESGKPEFVGFVDCQFLFKWRTNRVCPLVKPPLNCTFQNEDGSIQIDLSPLALNDSYYTVEPSTAEYDPKLKFSKQKVFLNICDKLPGINNTAECKDSSACLKQDANTYLNLGHFTQPLTFNKSLNALQLLYTGGYDQKNRPLTTLINFHCVSWSHNVQPRLIDIDQANGQYVVDFFTPAACPLQNTQGKDCMVTDPLTNNVFNLQPLSTNHFYTVRINDYEFELNICSPIAGGSCGDNVAICQKELKGAGRKFSLGKSTSSLSYWNSVINMTFVDGAPYNDPKKTPRKSHISFICNPDAQNGAPEFDGERDRAYFFRWYTAAACLGPIPKVTHCAFENETHFFDLSPLSLEKGNHFELGQSGSIVYINFCRPLNKLRDNLLRNCKPNSGICLIKSFQSGTVVSLGEPVGPPFIGFDNKIYLLYNNGDECPSNKSQSITSRVRFECDPELRDEASITFLDDLSNEDSPCTYEFVVQTFLACPRPLNDIKLDQQYVYTDKRTNLSADLGKLTSEDDYQIWANDEKQSSFFLNIDKPVHRCNNVFKDSAVCFQAPNNEFKSYGNINSAKFYIDTISNNNLHLRYINGDVCTSEPVQRNSSTDIEFLCDESKHKSEPVLDFQNNCIAKFKWYTSVVCNLIMPSCSLLDDDTGNYYSLRQLTLKSHNWNATSPFKDELYMINVCRPLPTNHNCGTSSAACKCTRKNGQFECNTNIGKVSERELTIDPNSKDLILLYEDGAQICDGSAAQTQIRFQCSYGSEDIHSSPKLVKIEHCTHYFVWKTIYACPQQNINNSSIYLTMDETYVVHDKNYSWKVDLHYLFDSTFDVPEKERLSDNYTYVFDFKKSKENFKTNCLDAAICQTKTNGFARDIGSINNSKFTFIGGDLFMLLHSSNSICGRNQMKKASSKIHFLCAPSVGMGHPEFIYENQDCEYFFNWETSHVCDLTELQPAPAAPISAHSSGISFGWVVFSLILFALFSFAGWLFVSSSSRRDDVVYHIRKIFRKNETPQIPFRYQQHIMQTERYVYRKADDNQLLVGVYQE